MRHLLPTVRSFLIQSSHAVSLVGVAVLAMAAAPLTRPTDPALDEMPAMPEAPPMTAVAQPAGPVTRLIAFEALVRGHAVNSPYGLRRLPGQAARLHEGVDIAAPLGTSVYVSAEGSVLRTGYEAAGYGRFVEIRHPNGMTTLYGHLSRLDVASGDVVPTGARIGLVGSTGRSTGPHLHFEVRRGERQVNPARVMGQTFEVVLSEASG
jgi:murein DD-endopeptidase MepM/ murein hydrolase activator NlpD